MTNPTGSDRMMGEPGFGVMRRSTADQASSFSNQRAGIDPYAQENGIDIVDWFLWDGVSGLTPVEDRPRGQELLDRIAQGEVKHVLFYDTSRLTRDLDPNTGPYYIKLFHKGGAVAHFVMDGLRSDADRATTVMAATVKGLGDSADSLKKSMRSAHALILLSQQGFSTGRKVNYGYMRVVCEPDHTPVYYIEKTPDKWLIKFDLEGNEVDRIPPSRVLNQETGKTKLQAQALPKAKHQRVKFAPSLSVRKGIALRIFEMSGYQGFGLRKIAAALNAEGIPGPEGGPWKDSTVRAILTNEIYVGVWKANVRNESRLHKIERKEKGEEFRITEKAIIEPKGLTYNPREDWIIHLDHDLAIVTTELWKRVQARFKSGTRRKNQHQDRSVYLLSEHLRCGHCGSPMNGNSGKYVCSGYLHHGADFCPYKGIDKEPLERFVLQIVEKQLRMAKQSAGLIDRIKSKLADRKGREASRAKAYERKIRELEYQIPLAARRILESDETLQPLLRDALVQMKQERDDAQEALEEEGRRLHEDEDLTALAEQAAATLRRLSDSLQGDNLALKKEVIRQVTEPIRLHFKDEKWGKRTVRRFERGEVRVKNLQELLAPGGSCTALNSGGRL